MMRVWPAVRESDGLIKEDIKANEERVCLVLHVLSAQFNSACGSSAGFQM